MKKIIIVVIVLITVTAFSFNTAFVLRCVDGDTLVVMLNGQKEYVRLLGVDTAESVKPGVEVQPGAIEASDFTKQITGKQIILTYDEKPRDFFGRLLAYVWLESDNGQLICWNITLIKAGHSELYTKYKFDAYDWFREAIE
ncbi:MAG: thermonuclease family protein [Oscillospiraceae bacterium]